MALSHDEIYSKVQGVLVDALHFDRSNSSIAELGRVPAHRLHYWQLCDGPTERPATTEEMIHAARYERMFPGEGGIDLVSRGEECNRGGQDVARDKRNVGSAERGEARRPLLLHVEHSGLSALGNACARARPESLVAWHRGHKK